MRCSQGVGKAATALEARRREQAQGDHPLQESFRAAAARLLEKYQKAGAAAAGKKGKGEPEEDSEEDEEDGSGEDDEEDGSGEDDESEEAEYESEEEEDGQQEEEEGGMDEERRARSHEAGPSVRQPDSGPALEGPLNVPFVLPLPESYDAARRLLDSVSSGDDVSAVIKRIIGSNRAALLQGNRRRMQELYGFLLQYFVEVAGRDAGVDMPRLDALTVALLELTPEVPLYAAAAFRARISKLQEQLARQEKAGAASNEAGKASAWPGPRALCLLQLAATVFPPSDARHPVLTPSLLLICGYLSLGRIGRPLDVARGLVLAGLALRLLSPAERLSPELGRFLMTALRWATDSLLKAAKGSKEAAEGVGPISLTALLSLTGEGLEGPGFMSQAATAALGMLRRWTVLSAASPAVPELTAGLRAQLSALVGKEASRKLPGPVVQQAAALADEVAKSVAACEARRRPLVRPRQAAAQPVRQFNPRFEDADGQFFSAERSYDPDRQRAEEQKLKKQVQKETRGAMRELRRDGDFLAVERDREKDRSGRERDSKQKAAISFLMDQQASFKAMGIKTRKGGGKRRK